VLDRDKTLVSPPFHTAFDPNFDTVKDRRSKTSWQVKTGFVIQRELSTQTKGETGESTAKTLRSTTKDQQGKKRKRAGNESIAQEKKGSPPANAQGTTAVNMEGGGLPATAGTSETATEEVPATTTRSGRKAKPTRRLIEVITAEIMEATSGNISGESICVCIYVPTRRPG
jgi:hypothetical protein